MTEGFSIIHEELLRSRPTTSLDLYTVPTTAASWPAHAGWEMAPRIPRTNEHVSTLQRTRGIARRSNYSSQPTTARAPSPACDRSRGRPPCREDRGGPERHAVPTLHDSATPPGAANLTSVVPTWHFRCSSSAPAVTWRRPRSLNCQPTSTPLRTNLLFTPKPQLRSNSP